MMSEPCAVAKTKDKLRINADHAVNKAVFCIRDIRVIPRHPRFNFSAGFCFGLPLASSVPTVV